MEATINIEQLDNGITLKYENADGDTEQLVALDENIIKEVGKMVWSDIKALMDYKLSNHACLKICITTDNTHYKRPKDKAGNHITFQEMNNQ